MYQVTDFIDQNYDLSIYVSLILHYIELRHVDDLNVSIQQPAERKTQGNRRSQRITAGASGLENRDA